MSEVQDLLVSHGRADMVLHGLPKGELRALAHASGRLSVLAGRVWLTRANDLDDHFLRPGDSIDVDNDARVLLEPWGSGDATVAWQGRSPAWGERVRRTCSRCWQLMNPLGRVALGTAAALIALAVAGAMFGPLADERSRSLAGASGPMAGAHNRAGIATRVGGQAGDVELRAGSEGAARQARRGAAGAA